MKEMGAMTRCCAVSIVVALVLGLPSLVGAQGGPEVVVYFHTDAIGSVRMVTDANGAVVDHYDYLPFGEPWPASPTGQETRRFTAQEKDLETGLDYFGARYYASLNGRFTRADNSVFSNPADPQTLALYVYAYNNPLRYTDPTGHTPDECPPGSEANFCTRNDPPDLGTILFWLNSLQGLQGASVRGRIVIPAYNAASWWGAFLSDLFSWESFGAAQINAQNKGYYNCIGDKMVPFKGLFAAAGAKAAEEVATHAAETNGSRLAGAYYHFTDGRFTAWGRSSKVLVPSAAGNIGRVAKGVSAVGWALTDIEGAHAIYECSGRLTGHGE
jgi:RHS repeat-associated protein